VAGRTFEANATERNGQAGEALFRQADRALYTAKGHGRNRVHVA